MVGDGVVVILSYPDTIVRPAYSEFSSRIWPLLGVGNKEGVQAGHAALLLIEKKTGKVNYYDFGRYITTYGYGRVRSKETDAELKLPLKATFKKGELQNIDELLLWLDMHPEKTHGEGRLVASINQQIDYEKAVFFIKALILKEEISYGAFVKKGTNCARFVTDTIIFSTLHKKIKRRLKMSNLFTPSPIGNVINGTTEKEIYYIKNKRFLLYKNRSILKEYVNCFFNKIEVTINKIGTELPNTDVFELKNGTWLGGIGSGAWFDIARKKGNVFEITRYTAKGINDFRGTFKTSSKGFDLKKAYTFVHPTTCKRAVVVQGYREFVFDVFIS